MGKMLGVAQTLETHTKCAGFSVGEMLGVAQTLEMESSTDRQTDRKTD